MKGHGLEKVRVVVQEVLHWSGKVLIRDGAGCKKCDMEDAVWVREGMQGRGIGWGNTEGSGMDWEGLYRAPVLLSLPAFLSSFLPSRIKIKFTKFYPISFLKFIYHSSCGLR